MSEPSLLAGRGVGSGGRKTGVGVEKANQAEEIEQGQELWTAWCDQKLGIARVGRPNMESLRAEVGEAEGNQIKERLLCQVTSWT